ncbi:MAG: DUF4118 domain-containing protein, partial [Bryobacteraceae bacterium]|nr:DUF4118 domain-containing protein [Bryobacteraceae bacterium]
MVSVGALTAVCRTLPVNQTTASLSYLLLVLVVASAWGLLAAISSSLVAAICLNFFFFPPVGTLTITDPQNWIALAAFLSTAVLASELSDRARKQAAEAVAQRREVERLYSLSRAVLLDPGQGSLGSTITSQIAETFNLRAVVLFDTFSRKTFLAGPEDIRLSMEEIELGLETGGLTEGTQAAAVKLGNKAVGILVVKGDLGTPALQAIANLIAISFEKAASEEVSSQARTARQSDELKSSILDALAHEFKTPLTSIKAASTSLLSRSLAPAHERELISIIDEEADRLTALVTEAIQISRIEAGKVKLNKAPTYLSDVVNSVLGQMKLRLEDRPVQVSLDPTLPAVLVDRDLIELAFRQLVDNALKYSQQGTSVSIQTSR